MTNRYKSEMIDNGACGRLFAAILASFPGILGTFLRSQDKK
jgi:hypothetical protein